jgi:hypothetical membrane protein
MNEWLERVGALAGFIGSTVITVGSIVTAAVYVGTKGQGYSPLNHWVSELGQVGVSRFAALFNLSLIVGGACFVLFMLGLTATRGGPFAAVYGLIGVAAGIGGLFVGVFPMSNLDLHGIAALTFFNLGWIVVGLASLDFVRRPDARFPPWLAYIGALTVAAFIGFLSVLLPLLASGDESLGAPDPRPSFWIVTVLEWAVLAGILAWVFATSLTWLRAIRGERFAVAESRAGGG